MKSPGLFITGLVYACSVAFYHLKVDFTLSALPPAAAPADVPTQQPHVTQGARWSPGQATMQGMLRASSYCKVSLFLDTRRKTALRELWAPVSEATTREQDAEH